MAGLENLANLRGVIVHTGRSKEIDLNRLNAALNYSSRANLIITGLGPDTNAALGFVGTKENPLDFHEGLWNTLVGKYAAGEIGPFCVDINSVNSKQSLTNTFPLGTNGVYAIFLDPLHLFRMKFLKKALQGMGRMSREVELTYVPTKKFSDLSFKEIYYETAALIKAFCTVWF